MWRRFFVPRRDTVGRAGRRLSTTITAASGSPGTSVPVSVSVGNASNGCPEVSFDGLIKEINEFQVRRRRSERRLNVPASNMPPPTKKLVPEGSNDRKATEPLSMSNRVHPEVIKVPSTPMPFVLRDPPVFTDIACTLHELENALFQLSESDKVEPNMQVSASETREDVGGLGTCAAKNEVLDFGVVSTSAEADADSGSAVKPVADPLDVVDTHTAGGALRCWRDDERFTALRWIDDNIAPVDVEWLSDRTVALILREKPQSLQGVVAGVNRALSAIVSTMEWSCKPVVLLRAASEIPFYTPEQSEMELPPSSRLELMQMKYRLFRRMDEASKCGAVFTAELSEPALDFGAELLFMCNNVNILGTGASKLRVGFPSIKFGVWPSLCVLQRISRLMECAEDTAVVASTMHLLAWKDLVDRCPKILQFVSVPCQHQNRWRFSQVVQKLYDFKVLFWRVLKNKLLPKGPSCGEGKHDIMAQLWKRYCALLAIAYINGGDVTNLLGSSLTIYAELLERRELHHVVHVMGALNRMHRRVFIPPPRTDTLAVPRGSAPGVSPLSAPFWIFTDEDPNEAARLIAEYRTVNGGTSPCCALLIGEPQRTSDVAALLDCIVFATPVGAAALPAPGGRHMVEVYVTHKAQLPEREVKVARSTALSCLQSRGIPYIVTKGGFVADRFVAALALEVCSLASEVGTDRIERVALQRLGFGIGPFELIDRYGTSRVSAAMRRRSHMMTCQKQVTSAACLLLSSMCNTKGICFYDTTGHANDSALRMTLSRELSDGEILVRLMYAMVNESCSLLLDGVVDTVDDVNLMSLFALAMSPSTGGILSCVDDIMGVATLLREIKYFSERYGESSLNPSPLLLAMEDARETFGTLSADTIRQARALCA
uniref:3-hydroxyacyl-CoA dehydrogenase C-terminal domain-containing protein n=1 Tax=Trypanosoma congolense (strain IL3000) TaxID=1068625 RepID=G0UX49_TRYCI|nr:conserved hypothetical protein [Trypanosoma congolense IL3000]